MILDAALALLYRVPVKRLNEQVKRNRKRFPGDFLFRLTPIEAKKLRSQNATSNESHGGRRYLPYAFTEHGAIMAATVLKSQRAIQMSIFVVRAFARMREALAQNQQIISKLAEIEKRLDNHETDIGELIRAVRQLMAPAAPNRRRIGFELPARAQMIGNRARIAV